ncbi:Pycsar system effector family protein [Dokdonia ponticola]|uniref:Pycsar system effector family protein n=1 Tax=Dokdonia ponticola TaxID=2041041 RepID=A0ABV9I412_9FLAO
MNEVLVKILDETKEWLKFAEAKNAMLLAFNAGSIYGISKLSFLNKIEGINFIDGYFSFVTILLVLSTATCLISFVPRLKFMYLSITNSKEENNIFFFEHLGESTPKQILKSLKEKGVKDEFSEIDTDIAVQIHSLANVARRKYGLFTIAIWITVSAYVSLIIAAIFAGYIYKK